MNDNNEINIFKSTQRLKNTDAELDSFIRKCTLSSMNYGNISNKLDKRKTIFQILLPYYSIVGVINSLLPRYFDNIDNTRLNYLYFWGIVISIVFLVISMQIALARYPERIENATKNLNHLKILKNQAEHLKINENATENDLKKLWISYNELIQSNVLVNRRYFYKTCKDYDSGNEKKTSNYESEVKTHFKLLEKVYINFTNFLESILYFFMFILPFIVYMLIFVII